jgi:hypothetical protein
MCRQRDRGIERSRDRGEEPGSSEVRVQKAECRVAGSR